MQKTFIKYLLLAIFICSSFTLSANAITQQDFINQHLKDRKLDNIEGIWITSTGRVYGFYKQGNQYVNKIISAGKRFRSGQIIGYLNKGSENVFYGKEDMEFNNRIVNGNVTYNVSGNILNITQSYNNTSGSFTDQRIWPDNITAHNEKFKTKDDVLAEEKKLAKMINEAKKTCNILGFEKGTEKFADCTLKLYSQKVDELVAEKQTRNQVVQNQSNSNQSSGSNVTTIYDPVRDSQNLINKGQKMLSGACTLGVNC